MTTNQKIQEALGKCAHIKTDGKGYVSCDSYKCKFSIDGKCTEDDAFNRDCDDGYWMDICSKCGKSFSPRFKIIRYDTSLDLLYDAAEKLGITSIELTLLNPASNTEWFYKSNRKLPFCRCIFGVTTTWTGKDGHVERHKDAETPQLALANALVAWIERSK